MFWSTINSVPAGLIKIITQNKSTSQVICALNPKCRINKSSSLFCNKNIVDMFFISILENEKKWNTQWALMVWSFFRTWSYSPLICSRIRVHKEVNSFSIPPDISNTFIYFQPPLAVIKLLNLTIIVQETLKSWNMGVWAPCIQL